MAAKFIVTKSDNLKGEVTIPASKSNTVRALFIGTLADGISTIENPLPSRKCLSTVEVCEQLGACIEIGQQKWRVHGVSGEPSLPDSVLDVGNSGTTLYIATATAALVNGYVVVSGDRQVRRRPAQPLIDALNDLGASAFSIKGNGCAPIVVRGKMRGGKTEIPGINSQWLTPLLINCPLAPEDTIIRVENLQERPYIEMTLGWLTRRGILYENQNFSLFKLRGGQSYNAFNERIPGDWESATFPLVAAAITNSEVTLYGLDVNDVQGDKEIIGILKRMGADLEVTDVEGGGGNVIRVRGGKELKGAEIDCSNIPDAIPILAVLGCCAKGQTILTNIGASRLKETNRPRVIREELAKMGAKIIEEGDALIIKQSKLHGARIDGHQDHRIVMAATIAGLVAEGTTIIDDAEYAAESFPNFFEVMVRLGASIEMVTEQKHKGMF
jgi:3-phosphoshikimate 1-carboxyvinyltransferase